MQTIKAQHGTPATFMAGQKLTVDALTSIGVGEQRVQNSQVSVGAHVRTIDLYLNWISTSSSGHVDISYYFIFRRSGQDLADIPNANFSDIGNSKVRNQIILSEIVQSGSEDAGGISRRHRIRVPKMFGRIREGDTWSLVFDSSANIEANIGFRFKWRI